MFPPGFRRSLTAVLLSLLLFTGAWAQSHISTQSHQSAVTAAVAAQDGSFFSAGRDGFLIRWTPDGLGEHYQVSELDIPMIAIHPGGSDIAVYETDGFSVHRVSVWNWPSLQRRFVQTFSNNITSLEFTARGSLLAVGTATVSGMVFLNPSTGRTVPKLRETTGVVSMFCGSASERSAVLYSPAGFLSYYDMTSGARKERFQTEPQLEQLTMLNGNLLCAGVKGNQIHVIDALSGKTAARISARSPVLLRGGAGSTLHYVEGNGRDSVLKVLETQITGEGISVSTPAPGRPLGGSAAITTGILARQQVFLGTKDGHILSLSLDGTSEERAGPVSENIYERILDIDSAGESFYFLTRDTIFRSSYDTGRIDTVGGHSGFTNIVSYGEDAILWSRGTRKAVVLMDLGTNRATTLFTPGNQVEGLRLFGDKIVYIEGNTSVRLYDMQTGSGSELYSGTGIQDAVLHGTDLYVAKSASSSPRSPLVSVDIETRETVAMPVDGSVVFSLALDSDQGVIYGIQAVTQGNGTQTRVFAFQPERRRTGTIMSLAGEDVNAFLTVHGSSVYTNIGKSQIRSYDTKTRREMQMGRSASLPLKLVQSGSRIAVLNRDGSISWYSPDGVPNAGGQVLADWYMTAEKQWREF